MPTLPRREVRHRPLVIALAAAVSVAALAGCSDSVGPPAGLPPGTTVRVDPARTLRVCKDGGSPAGVFHFTISRSGNLHDSDVWLPTTAMGPSGCVTVYTRTEADDADSDAFVLLKVAESPLGGMAIEQIEEADADGPSTIFGSNEVTVSMNAYHDAVVTFYNALSGNQGCTPGYWKNHGGNGTYAALAGRNMNAYFGVSFFPPSLTLGAALSQGGGGVSALGRHAAAAAMNAFSRTTVAYAYRTYQVRQIVQSASGFGFEAAKDKLEAANEGAGGCPLR